MPVIHFGDGNPRLPEEMHPDDHDVFCVSWTGKLNGVSIATSEWIVPDGFEVEDEETNITVTEDGVQYSDTNTALVSTTLEEGTHALYNRITAPGGIDLTRGFDVTIR